MGQEIVYCCRCQVRLVGGDFDKGDAYRVGEQVACQKCAMEMLATAPLAVQQQILEQKKRALDRKIAPHSASSVWRGLARVSPALQAVKVEKTSRSQIAAIVGIGLALVLFVVMALMSGGSPHPPPPPPAPPPPPVVIPGPSPKEAAAAEAKRELEATARKTAAELTALLDRAREMGAKCEYQKAADLLAGARKNHLEPQWTKPIDDRIQELENAMAAEFPALRDKAVDARKRDGAAELSLLRDKVALWGSARYTDELEKSLAEVFPPIGAKDGVLKLTVADAMLQGNHRFKRTTGEWKVIQNWSNAKDYLEWNVVPRQAGLYAIRLNYAYPKEMSGIPLGGEFEIAVSGGEAKQFAALYTTGWGDFKTIPYGTITLPATASTISIRPVRIQTALMSLRFIELVPSN